MNHSIESLFEKTQVHARKVMGARYQPQGGLDHTFAELGIDSLYLTEISFALLSELDLYVPMAQVARTRTVREFLQLVLDELQAAQT